MCVMSLNDDDMRAYELLPPHNFDVVSVIAKKLEEVTPLEYVESRDGPAASELVYISGNGLVNMLNNMFGWNGWRNEVLGEHLETWQEGKHWVCCARVKVCACSCYVVGAPDCGAVWDVARRCGRGREEGREQGQSDGERPQERRNRRPQTSRHNNTPPN